MEAQGAERVKGLAFLNVLEFLDMELHAPCDGGVVLRVGRWQEFKAPGRTERVLDGAPLYFGERDAKILADGSRDGDAVRIGGWFVLVAVDRCRAGLASARS